MRRKVREREEETFPLRLGEYLDVVNWCVQLLGLSSRGSRRHFVCVPVVPFATREVGTHRCRAFENKKPVTTCLPAAYLSVCLSSTYLSIYLSIYIDLIKATICNHDNTNLVQELD